jgi:hypothetical protein
MECIFASFSDVLVLLLKPQFSALKDLKFSQRLLSRTLLCNIMLCGSCCLLHARFLLGLLFKLKDNHIINNNHHLIGSRTLDLPVCSIVP